VTSPHAHHIPGINVWQYTECVEKPRNSPELQYLGFFNWPPFHKHHCLTAHVTHLSVWVNWYPTDHSAYPKSHCWAFWPGQLHPKYYLAWAAHTQSQIVVLLSVTSGKNSATRHEVLRA
jgi:hypothetical protein